MKSQNTRKERDVMKLLMSNYEVTVSDENNHNDLYVIFHGPKDSPYEGVNLFFFINNLGLLESACAFT